MELHAANGSGGKKTRKSSGRETCCTSSDSSAICRSPMILSAEAVILWVLVVVAVVVVVVVAVAVAVAVVVVAAAVVVERHVSPLVSQNRFKGESHSCLRFSFQSLHCKNF